MSPAHQRYPRLLGLSRQPGMFHLGSGGEDLLAMPVEILAGRWLGTWRQEQRLEQGWLTVVLAGQRVSMDRVRQGVGDMDAQPSVDGQQAGVERHIVGGA